MNFHLYLDILMVYATGEEFPENIIDIEDKKRMLMLISGEEFAQGAEWRFYADYQFLDFAHKFDIESYVTIEINHMIFGEDYERTS